MTKSEIRKLIKEKREKLPKEYFYNANKIITEKVLSCEGYKKAKTVFVYISKTEEVDTYGIIEDALKNGKKVAIPKCINEKNMKACEIKNLEDCEFGLFNIMEPKSYAKEVNKEDIDFSLIPCISCTRDGVRLGYGRGYYDRFLHELETDTAVLCYGKLMTDEIPQEAHDVKIKRVICESEQTS